MDRPATVPFATDALERKLRVAGAVAAGALVAFGVILFIAANWDDLAKPTRFALAGGVVLLSAIASVAVDRLRVPAGLVGVAGIGGLLGLIGQTYQTGADPWSLFALWAALALPWAVAARHDSVWALWVAVVHTALPLWLHAQGALGNTGELDSLLMAWLAAGLITALLGPTLDLSRWIGSTRWSFRLSVVSTCVLVAATAFPAVFGPASINLITVAGLAALAITIALLAGMKPFDMALLATATLALDVLLIAIVAVNARNADLMGSLFLISIVSVGIVAGSAAAVIAIARQRLPDLSPAGADAAMWPVLIVTTIGALIAAIPILTFIFLLLGTALTKGSGLYIAGTLLVAGAAWAASVTRPLGFAQQLAIILLVSGACLFGIALYRDTTFGVASLTMLLLSCGLALAVPARWMAAVLGMSAAVFAIMTVASLHATGSRGLPASFLLGHLVVAALAAAAIRAIEEARRASSGTTALELLSRADRFVLGWATAALVALMIGNGSTFLVGANWTRLSGAIYQAVPLDLHWTLERTLSMAMVVGAAAWAFISDPRLRTVPAIAVAAVLSALAFVITALGGPIAILAVALASGRRILAIFAIIAAAWIIGAFYYWLGWPLLHKAGLLLTLGLALGAALLLSARARPALTELGALPRLAPGLSAVLIALSLLATTAVAASAIWQKEQLLAAGRPIYVALAPVDPRSLMQGDYMTLRFALPNSPRPAARSAAAPPSNWATATVDDRGVATIQALTVERPRLQTGEVALRIATKGGRVVLGTDAYYFREGTGSRYTTARYGEFRVDGDGNLVLVGLTGDNLQPLK